MRKTLIFSALFLLGSSSLFAADAPTGQWRISVLASEISEKSQPWSDTQAGVGLGIAYAPTAQWDVELTVASRSHVSPYTRLMLVQFPTVTDPGLVVPVTEFRSYRVTPIDLSATRHFLADSPIAPYVRAGVRYVGAPGDPASTISYAPIPGSPFIPVTEGFHFGDRISAQAGAGARIRLTPRTAIRAEVNRLIRSDAADFDPLTRYAVGLSWLF